MRHTLQLHPASPCSSVTHIEVEVLRPRDRSWALTYVVTGKMSDLAIPPLAAATRVDELWRHTCFEAFIGSSQGAAYYEFNFAPSTQWAAYRFSGYRSGMRVVAEISAPRIEWVSSPERCILQASLELDQVLASSEGRGECGKESRWRLGLSAVIEEAGSRLSHWALAHPSGRPDFHHPDCFTLELPEAQKP